MHNSPTASLRSIILFLLFFFIIAVVYSPVLYFDYLFHDDCCFWVKLKEYGFKYYAHDLLIAYCRFGLAWLFDLEHFFVHKILDLKFLRFLAIVISSGNAFFLLKQMRRLSFSDVRAFLVISAMFFLPGFAETFFYASTFALVVTFSLACWSFHRIETGKGMVIPIFSFLLAITIYPSVAMFYWTMTGLYILFVPDRFSVLFRRNIFRLMVAGLLGLLIYAILVFLMHYFFSSKIGNSLHNPYVISSDWPSKLQWFFQEPIGNALNLWNIFPQVITSIIVSGFILFTALLVLTKKLHPP